MNIQEIRQKYPQYNDLSDTSLAGALHKKFYSDIPFEDFSQRVGLQSGNDASEPPSVPTDEQVERAKSAPPEAPRNFFDTVQDQFSRVREGFKTPGVPMAHLVEPQVKYAKENPDVVAATAASLLAPPLAVPAAISKAGTLGKLAVPLIRNAPQVFAAMTGGAAGGAAKEAINSPDATLDSIIKQSVRSGLEMGAAETAGIAASGLISKIAAPGAKTLTEQGKNLIDFAKQHGLKLKPSAVSPSTTAKVIESGVESFLPGRVVKQFANKNIANVLATNTPDANRLIAEVTKVYGKNSPGLDRTTRSASKALQEALEDLTPRAEAKYGAFVNAIGGRDRWTDYPKLKEAFQAIKASENVIAGGADDATMKFADAFMAKYPAQISANDLYAQYKRISRIKGADKRNLGMIRNAFKSEFDDLASVTGGDASKLLKEANVEYALGNRYIKDPPGVVHNILTGKITDDKVTVSLFRDSNFNLLKQLESRIPQETFRNLQRSSLETLIQNSSITPEGSFVSVLNGKKLLNWIDKNPRTMSFYPKETQEAFRNLALYAKFHGKEALAGAKGWESIGASSLLTGGLFGGSAFVPHMTAGLAVTSAAAPALAWSMMRPNSLINQWLVRGEIGPFAKGINEGLRVGGRLVFQDSLQNKEQLE